MATSDIVLALIAAFGGLSGIGGLIAAITAARQAKTAARRGEVESLAEALAGLQAENKRLRERVEELEAEVGTLRGVRFQIGVLEEEVRWLRAENVRLRKRVADLERENRILRSRYEADAPASEQAATP